MTSSCTLATTSKQHMSYLIVRVHLIVVEKGQKRLFLQTVREKHLNMTLKEHIFMVISLPS